MTAPEIGYIYPAPYWRLGDHDWVKSLLLFFDQVAILLPDYMYGRHYQADPTLVGPLEERGLLRILEPGAWIDAEARTELSNTISLLLDAGAFDALDLDVHFQELSQSRAGYGVDIDVADELVERLTAAALVGPSRDGVSLPMHPVVRSTFLVLLGQLARGVGARSGEVLHPTTAYRQGVDDLARFLLVDQVPAVAPMIETDLIHVGVNTAALPLDDVVALRDEHRAAHASYMRSLRGFVDELSHVQDTNTREQLILERREAIDDEARRIQKQLRLQTRQVASVGIGIAGAAWSAKTGDPVGLAATAASLLLGLGDSDSSAGAYTYLFQVDGR